MLVFEAELGVMPDHFFDDEQIPFMTSNTEYDDIHRIAAQAARLIQLGR